MKRWKRAWFTFWLIILALAVVRDVLIRLKPWLD